MPFANVNITQPSHEPIGLAEAKDYLRVVSTDQDDFISSLITAARLAVEQYTRRIMVSQQWKLSFDKFPGSWPFSYGFGSSLLSPYREIHLPLSPVISVDSFQYVDMNTGDLTTMDPTTDYQVSLAEPARLQPGYGLAWPVARWVIDAVQITYTVGYGDTTASPVVGSDPPMPLIIAMKQLIALWYETREAQMAPTLDGMPNWVKALLIPYRVWDVAPVLNNWERFGR